MLYLKVKKNADCAQLWCIHNSTQLIVFLTCILFNFVCSAARTSEQSNMEHFSIGTESGVANHIADYVKPLDTTVYLIWSDQNPFSKTKLSLFLKLRPCQMMQTSIRSPNRCLHLSNPNKSWLSRFLLYLRVLFKQIWDFRGVSVGIKLIKRSFGISVGFPWVFRGF